MDPHLTSHGVEQVLAKIASLTFIVVGDAMLDESYFGSAHRVSPEAPIPVVRVHACTSALGGAANVGMNLRRLGARVKFAGVVGDDEYGHRIVDNLASNQIDGTMVIVPGRQTTRKMRVFANGWHMARLDFETCSQLPLEIETQLQEALQAEIGSADGIILSDYSKGVLSRTLTQHVIHEAQLASKSVYVGPKGKDFTKYIGAAAILPNVHEALRAVGKDPADFEAGDFGDSLVEEVGRTLQRMIGCKVLNITRGASGSTVFQADNPPVHVPAFPATARDVTGAGDTVISAFSAALTAGRPPTWAAYFANLVASIAIQTTGTATISAQDVLAAVKRSERQVRGMHGTGVDEDPMHAEHGIPHSAS